VEQGWNVIQQEQLCRKCFGQLVRVRSMCDEPQALPDCPELWEAGVVLGQFNELASEEGFPDAVALPEEPADPTLTDNDIVAPDAVQGPVDATAFPDDTLCKFFAI
jgi:hypothetical protein